MPWPRLFAVLGVAVVAGVAGGLAGGAIALNLDNEPTTTPVSVLTSATLPPSEGERMRDAIAHVSPAVVTVIVDLPPLPQGEGILQRQNLGIVIVISEQGLVITNFHVIDGAAEVGVILSTG